MARTKVTTHKRKMAAKKGREEAKELRPMESAKERRLRGLRRK